MKQSKKMFASVLAIVALFALSIAPASAHEAPAVIACTGTATVSPGLHFPGVGPSKDFTFSLTTTCTTSGGSATLTAEGKGHGWCGASTASGEGKLRFADGHEIGFTFNWTSGGQLLIVTGEHEGGSTGTLAGTVVATGGADCATPQGATSFDVTIDAAAV
jgi:hypothetical protein